MKTQFSIISYFDPYGDMKSNRKELSRKNYQSHKSIDKITKIIETYNDSKYYNAVKVSNFDNRLKDILDFDKSYYLMSKAPESIYLTL